MLILDWQWRSQDFKVGGTPVTWPEGPMRGWNFWGGAAERAPSPSVRRSGGELSLPLKKSPRTCTNPVAVPVDGRGSVPPSWLRYCGLDYLLLAIDWIEQGLTSNSTHFRLAIDRVSRVPMLQSSALKCLEFATSPMLWPRAKTDFLRDTC